MDISAHFLYIPIIFLAGAAIGGVIVWQFAKTRTAPLVAELKFEKSRQAEQEEVWRAAEAGFRDAFKALSLDALKSSNEEFLKLAREQLEGVRESARGDLEQRRQAVENLVTPIRESLEKVNSQVNQLEASRREAYGELREQVRNLATTNEGLRQETGNLAKAMRAPTVRGRWGEIQLRNVVEMAGMQEYCDFIEQASRETEDGRMRPDLIVRLPGDKKVVVDAKAPLQSYLDAQETDNEAERSAFMKSHARHILDHMKNLGSKKYWSHLDDTTEFVIMFLPGENFFSAALREDPQLIERGVEMKVILATPTTLISLLRAVAYGWKQEKVAQSAHLVSQLGRDLYDRLRVLADHFASVGKGLDRAVDSYNKAVGTLESRVLVSARRFTELGADTAQEIREVEPLEKTTRTLQAPEMMGDDS